MNISKNVKIVVFLLIMFLTAYPTFLALAFIQFLIWYSFAEVPSTGWRLEIDPSGYYLIPIIIACAIAFFISLVMLIKTVKSK